MAETVIGWKGITVVPTWTIGKFDLAAEVTHIDYNTNWQAWGFPNKAIDNSIYPNFESDAGVGSYRNAFAPFQDRKTDLYVLKGKTVVDYNKGRRRLRQAQVHQRDRQPHDRRALPALQARRLPGGRRRLHQQHEQLQRQRQLDGVDLRPTRR